MCGVEMEGSGEEKEGREGGRERGEGGEREREREREEKVRESNYNIILLIQYAGITCNSIPRTYTHTPTYLYHVLVSPSQGQAGRVLHRALWRKPSQTSAAWPAVVPAYPRLSYHSESDHHTHRSAS